LDHYVPQPGLSGLFYFRFLLTKENSMSALTGNTSEVVAVRIPPDLLSSLDSAARRLGVRRSQFIRSVLLQGMIAHWSAMAPTSQPRGEDARLKQK
jgi:hypothetical protein